MLCRTHNKIPNIATKKFETTRSTKTHALVASLLCIGLRTHTGYILHTQPLRLFVRYTEDIIEMCIPNYVGKLTFI